MMDGIPYGLTKNLPTTIYHRREIGVASKSALQYLLRSPAHYQAWCRRGSRVTPAMRFGSACHTAVLEPEKFESDYVVRPEFGDCRKKENRAAKDAWLATTTGREELTSDELDTITGIASAIHAHPVASKLFCDGDAELTIAWMDADTGVDCKGRLDYYRAGVVADLKTTDDASPEGFAREIAKYKYHVQAAMYLRGLQACGESPKGFVFVAVEKEPPYAVGVYELEVQAIDRGNDLINIGLSTIAQCLRDGRWPAYSEHVVGLELPHWAA